MSFVFYKYVEGAYKSVNGGVLEGEVEEMVLVRRGKVGELQESVRP